MDHFWTFCVIICSIFLYQLDVVLFKELDACVIFVTSLVFADQHRLLDLSFVLVAGLSEHGNGLLVEGDFFLGERVDILAVVLSHLFFIPTTLLTR